MNKEWLKILAIISIILNIFFVCLFLFLNHPIRNTPINTQLLNSVLNTRSDFYENQSILRDKLEYITLNDLPKRSRLYNSTSDIIFQVKKQRRLLESSYKDMVKNNTLSKGKDNSLKTKDFIILLDMELDSISKLYKNYLEKNKEEFNIHESEINREIELIQKNSPLADMINNYNTEINLDNPHGLEILFYISKCRTAFTMSEALLLNRINVISRNKRININRFIPITNGISDKYYNKEDSLKFEVQILGSISDKDIIQEIEIDDKKLQINEDGIAFYHEKLNQTGIKEIKIRSKVKNPRTGIVYSAQKIKTIEIE